MQYDMLYYCPVCSRRIALEAQACPGCGLPITKQRREEMISAADYRREEEAQADQAERNRIAEWNAKSELVRQELEQERRAKDRKYPNSGLRRRKEKYPNSGLRR